MATYGQLLIDAGGGVVDHGKQSARQDGATLVIGLGGTGSDAVMKLKKEVFKQLKPDDENAVLPTYSAIKYLVVDSDASKINAQVGKLTDIDRNTEFFEISNSNIKATFGATEILKKNAVIVMYTQETGFVKKQLRLHREYMLLQEYCMQEKTGFSLLIIGVRG